MKKRMLSLLLCLVMFSALLPAFTLSVRAEAGDGQNVSNTSMDTFEALKFNTGTSELTAAVNANQSPTGPGSFAIRTISELLVSGKGGWNEGKAPGLYDYGATPRGMNFSSKTDGYMYNLISRTSANAYTNGSLPTDYTYVKSLAFDPTGDGKDDFVAYLYATNSFIQDSGKTSRSAFTLYVTNKDGIVSSVYDLGTTPFVLLRHQADAYRYANTNLNVRLSSLTDGPSGDENPFKMDQENENIDHYLAATYSYNAATKTYVSDGPATWIDVDDDDYNSATNLREHIYDGNTLYDAVFAPLEVLGFAEKGAGCADSVFINGFVCDYGSTRVYALTFTRETTVTANFAAKGTPYTVTVTNGSGSGSYYEGDLVSITADPAPTGKVFSGWTSADGVSFAAASAAATTFFMPGRNVYVTANYGAPNKGQTFTLYFRTNGGSALDPVTAARDTVIDLTPYRTVRAGYVFGGWYLDERLIQPVTAVTLTGDVTVYAGWTEGSSVRLLNTRDHIAYLTGFANGRFEPGRNITRAQTAMLFYRLLDDQTAGGRKTFRDVDTNAWYGKAVEKLAGLGIINGYANGTFRTGNSITRAEFVAMATRFANLTAEDCYFTDVSRGSWAYSYIAFASNQGWISGYADGTFRPGNSITRAEVTKIVNRMLGRAADVSFVDSHGVRSFPDVTRAYWAYYEIAEASNVHDYTRNAAGAESWTGIR